MHQVTKELYLTVLLETIWGWICTLSVPRQFTADEAQLAFVTWVRFLEDLGYEELVWARTASKSRSSHRTLEFYVLVAGVARCNADRAEREWRRLAGEAAIEPYDGEHGDLDLMTRMLSQGANFSMGAKIQPRRAPRAEESDTNADAVLSAWS